jgi:hypothetical protein
MTCNRSAVEYVSGRTVYASYLSVVVYIIRSVVWQNLMMLVCTHDLSLKIINNDER